MATLQIKGAAIDVLRTHDVAPFPVVRTPRERPFFVPRNEG